MFGAHSSANPARPLGGSLENLPLWTHQMDVFLSRIQTQVFSFRSWRGLTGGYALQNETPRLEQKLCPGGAVCPKISSISWLFNASWLEWLETKYGYAHIHACVYRDIEVSSISAGFSSPPALCSSSAVAD